MAFWVENRTSLVKLGQSFSLLTRPETKHHLQWKIQLLNKIKADLGKLMKLPYCLYTICFYVYMLITFFRSRRLQNLFFFVKNKNMILCRLNDMIMH